VIARASQPRWQSPSVEVFVAIGDLSFGGAGMIQAARMVAQHHS